MRKVYGLPTPEIAHRENSSGINQVVINLARHLPSYGYELVNSPGGADLIAHHAGNGQGHTDVAFFHGVYPTAHQHFDKSYWEINRRVLADCLAAKAVIAPSEWIADVLRRDLRIQPRVVGWGVNPEEWRHNEQPEGYVLWNKNRPDDVCTTEWVERLAEALPEVQFISTFGRERPNLKIIGRVDHSTMKAYIQKASVYLATTKETGDIGSRESLAAAVPVVGFRAGAVTDIVHHGSNGFLAEYGDFPGLVAGVEYVLRNRPALSRNALESARQWTWDITAQKIAYAFDAVLDTPAPKYKVSVIIPCYNYARFLREAILSACHQNTHFDYEIIVVDDGSTDNSALVARQEYPHPVKFIQQQNQGVAAARNNGIRAASGQYIVCLDADDQIAPDFLQVLADTLDKNPLAGIAYARLQVMDRGTSGWLAGAFDYEQHLAGHNQVPTCNMFLKEAWARVGGYRQHKFPAEDADLWLRITSAGYTAVKATEAPLFLYRMHNESQTAVIRQGGGKTPDWTGGKGWIAAGELPAFAGGKVRPVRNYDQPVASFIIPVGPGHETLVYDALDSVESQSLVQWEAIVINDSDKPLDLTGYPFVKVIETPGRVGASKARNLGIHVARGKFIVFLDADDYLHHDFLAMAVKLHKQTGRYVYTDWWMDTTQGAFEAHESPEFTPSLIFEQGYFHPITTLLPTAWAREVGGFDETMQTWEDWDFYTRLIIAGHCGQRLPAALLTYRYKTGTLREQGQERSQRLKDELYQKYEDYIEKRKVVVCACAAMAAAQLNEPEELVEVEYLSSMSAKHTVYGASKRFYGRRAGGDRFFVIAKDAAADPVRFKIVTQIVEDVTSTVMPPEYDLA